jgi:sodium transport system permease protein
MRWSIVRLIWFRELRDQLRDRRTLFMIVVLPILLYPVGGIALMQLATGFLAKQQSIVGIVGKDNLPAWQPRFHPAVEAGGWLACLPAGPDGLPGAVARTAGSWALAQGQLIPTPPLLMPDGEDLRFLPSYLDPTDKGEPPRVQPFADINEGRAARDGRQIDLLLVIPEEFAERLEENGRSSMEVLGRDGDDRSRLVNTRVSRILLLWKLRLKDGRLARQGLPTDYDDPVEIRDPERAKSAEKRSSEELFKLLVQMFPFVLVMWSLAGALYPAVDVCAGEKERGTMETLLISPASREEIVWGKFLTIWVFSGATSLLNLVSMGLTTWFFSRALPEAPFRLGMLFWGVLLLVPLSAFFSALCLAVGVYARSSKEGQYYLMPLFLITMPLIFLTLAPGVQLNAFYSMVPVTGVALLLQALMTAAKPPVALGVYFIPVLAPMIVYGWLALRWAIEQFQREEVLFREAERVNVWLWLRGLFRDREARPSTGQAMLCFALVMGLSLAARTLPLGDPLQVLTQLGIINLACVGAPPLFLAGILTTRPLETLGLRRAPLRDFLIAIALAALLFLPSTQLTYAVLQHFSGLREALHEVTGKMKSSAPMPGAPSAVGLAALTVLLVVVALCVAACEELAFRGFILSGLRQRFRPAAALILSSFFFALLPLNVFQLAPHFMLGLVLGLLVQHSGSVLPSITFHFVFNTLVYHALIVCPHLFPDVFAFFIDIDKNELTSAGVAVGACSTLAAAGLLLVLLRGPVGVANRSQDAPCGPC